MSLFDGREPAFRGGPAERVAQLEDLTATKPQIFQPYAAVSGIKSPDIGEWHGHHAHDTVHLRPLDIGVDSAAIAVEAPGVTVKLTVPLSPSNSEALKAGEGLALAPLFAEELTRNDVKPVDHNAGFTTMTLRRDVNLDSVKPEETLVMSAIRAHIQIDKDLSYEMAPIVRPDWMIKLARRGFAPVAVSSDKAWGLPSVEHLGNAPKLAAHVPYQVVIGIRGNDIFMVGFNADGSLMRHECFGKVTKVTSCSETPALQDAFAALVSSAPPKLRQNS